MVGQVLLPGVQWMRSRVCSSATTATAVSSAAVTPAVTPAADVTAAATLATAAAASSSTSALPLLQFMPVQLERCMR